MEEHAVHGDPLPEEEHRVAIPMMLTSAPDK